VRVGPAGRTGSVDVARLPEAGRWRSLYDFYVTTMRTAVASQLQYRVTNYFYMLGMIAEPVVYLVVWTTIAEQQGGAVGGITAGGVPADLNPLAPLPDID